MAEIKPMPELAASVWENISSFLYPYEQCKILSLNKYINKLNEDGTIKIPQHNFQNDLNFWKEHFNPYQEFGFADINVKDKLTTLSLNNGVFDGDWVVGDMLKPVMYRLSLDEVEQEIQRAVFPFSSGLPVTFSRMVELPNGSYPDTKRHPGTS